MAHTRADDDALVAAAAAAALKFFSLTLLVNVSMRRLWRRSALIPFFGEFRFPSKPL